jgi:hypothetical protein
MIRRVMPMTAPDVGAYPRRRPKVSHGASAVVTGAGSGIGRGFAEVIVARGGRVVCADINLASAQETVDKLGAANALAVACDVRYSSWPTPRPTGWAMPPIW